MKKLNEFTIHESLEKLNSGEICSKDLVEACLQRIEETEPQIRAFLSCKPEKALARAAEEDGKRRKKKAGPLSGIPIAIKDLISTKDFPTTCGSKMLQGYTPPYNATVIEKLEAAGAVVLGKLAMDEFAMGSSSETCYGQIPENPWKKGYVAGGSSGGSAASVSAAQCLASLGSDTGGSVRQPASLCGVVGMKPTYGRVSRYGLVAFASSLDQIGPLTRDVRDCALLMNCLAGYDERDSTSSKQGVDDYQKSLQTGLKGKKIGVAKEFFGEGLDREVAEILNENINLLRESGAEIVDISLPHTKYSVAAYYIIAPAEASSNLARYDGVVYGYRDNSGEDLMDMYKKTRSSGFGDEVKKRILIGTYALSSGYYDAYYKKATQVRSIIRDDYIKAFERCDAVLSAVSPTPAWKIGEKKDDPMALYLSDIFSLSANLAGIPGMSVPGGFTSTGLPVGIQLQGPHFREDILFRVGYNIEKANGLGNSLARLS